MMSLASQTLLWLATIGWYVMAAIGLIGSAMFSGQETGIYRLNRVRLHIRAHRPHSSAAILDHMVRNPNRVLGTLLIGNNLANYMATYAIAVLLAGAAFKEWQQVVINAAILTPLLFVVGEVLPKDMFTNYADRLSYLLARPLYVVQVACMWSGLLPLIVGISNLLGWLLRTPRLGGIALHPRRAVTQLMKEGLGQGLISPYQSEMIDRVLESGGLTVRSEMVPWPKVTAARTSQPPEAIWALADRVPFARLPLMDVEGRCVGVIAVDEVLRVDPDDCPPLESFAKPAPQLAPDLSVRAALIELRRRRASLALVVENDKPIGLLTVKDLVEPIIGELEVW